MNSPENQRQLEAWVDATVRGLPPRSAPASLEARVLAAIAARQSLPWWRQSFVHWPVAIRVVFLLLTVALGAATVWVFFRTGGATPMATAGDVLSAPVAWWQETHSALRSLVALVARSLSPTAQLWIYGALAIVGLCYATVIGAGAMAYRFFWRSERRAAVSLSSL